MQFFSSVPFVVGKEIWRTGNAPMDMLNLHHEFYTGIALSRAGELLAPVRTRATGPIFSMPASWRFVGECDVMQVADHLRIHQSTPITSSCVIHGGFVVTFGGLMEST